jgi:hypothetical protein
LQRCGQLLIGESGETDISAKQACAQAPARVSREDGDGRGAQSDRRAARQGPEKALRLIISKNISKECTGCRGIVNIPGFQF